ncbi:ribonuclease J [Rhizomicrobium palustre]|uniref:Ribonuclease J n=1 Tax=Rhizomicrobium palustre TaxID=189966 RepID=A0A846N368_9PROT|nr:ribonuclease J [Rhizomicrobium palustre]
MAKINDDELVLLPLGGAGEIGMNFNAYGYGPGEDKQWLVLDCGVLFGREAATPGVDLIVPDISFLAERRRDVLAIVATHAHEDHIGAIHLLWPMLKCPVYATPFTAKLIEGKLIEAGIREKVKLHEIPLHGKFSIGPYDLELVSITHSILEPNAVAIKTPLGTVVHTGDWKIDPAPQLGEATDINRFKALGDEGVLAMVCDSTNALVEGHSGSEGDVKKSLTELIGTLKGRIAVTAFASNVARVDTIAKAAKANGRHIVLVGRAMHKIVQAAKDSGYLKDFPPILDPEDAENLPASKVLYICTGSQGESRAALTRIAAGEHVVKLGPGDSVIFSSRIIPGNEIGIFDLHNKLTALGVDVLSADDHFVHVSGHPCRGELSEMYGWVRPKIAVPVHGELRHMHAHAELAKSLQVSQAVVIENGHMLRLAPGRASVIDETPAGRVHLDGEVLVAEGLGLARARRSLSFAGMIAITLVLDGKGRPATEASIIFEGIPEPVHEAVREAVEKCLHRHNPKKDDEGKLKEAVRRAARSTANDAWGKKPITRVDVVVV